jgi:hypothetical protein
MSPLVLAEVIGVLKSFSRYSMTAIAHVIISLVSASGTDVGNRQLILNSSPSMSGCGAQARSFAPLFLLGTTGSRGLSSLAVAL